MRCDTIDRVSFLDDLEARLKAPLPGADAQLAMSPRQPGTRPLARKAPSSARQAAALILLVPGARATDYNIILTVRRHDLVHHPGQISLPGGGIDVGETAEAAALREADEEIGVDPATIRVLGSLTPLYVIVSGFVVTPFVGVVAERPRFRAQEREVAEILEVPLTELSDPARRLWGTRTREGYLIDFPYFSIGAPPGHQVWGATAMMLAEFVQVFT